MLDFSLVSLDQIVVHRVGNKLNNERLTLSHTPLQLKDPEIGNLLTQYFIRPFKNEIFYNFFSPAGLDNNYLYPIISDIFENPENFFEHSHVIATHLYEQTNHANIKEGELYITYMKNCRINRDEYVDAIGIFKSETKETFLKVYVTEETANVSSENGVNINKLDKGCIIFNSEKDNGYILSIIDHTTRSTDIAQFWQQDFLQAKLREDKYFQTETYLNMCKGFCEEVFTPENEVERTDQMLLLKKSMDFFNKNKQFDEKEFESTVIKDPGVIEAFQNYKNEYSQKHDVPVLSEFDISNDAYKQNKKYFKSVLKLDKKFHVYVHGGHNFIERGFDEDKKMNYYKLFFDEEF